MVGAKLDGFDVMVKLTEEAPIIILEGDEYLSSPIDRRPKFHLYKPNIGVISGIAWDHINVFPTFENYIDQFRIFKNLVSDCLIFCEEDPDLKKLMKEDTKCKTISYNTPNHTIKNGTTYLENIPLKIFGKHNLQNLNAARLVCKELGISDSDFYNNIKTFNGASNRLELIREDTNSSIYKDFAHSPSKLIATIDAVKKQFKDRKLVACMELHTFSSLNKKFLSQYVNSMNNADEAIIYFSLEAIKHKRLDPISKEDIKLAFKNEKLKVINDKEELINHLKDIYTKTQIC